MSTTPPDADDGPPMDGAADLEIDETLDEDALLLAADDLDPVVDESPDVDADIEAHARCPHCGEELELTLDPGGGSVQEYIEDCFVCCRPYTVFLEYDDRGEASVQLEPADGN